ncbi:MAG: prolipoprotein diacylglyceryl transferase [Planctomycetaceae bacterium]|jgi:phosphatidylglycerol:prolipoprotein diacylglycerol transferase|nr:prolipoprotein diacylglyceryl transferase [Planctomycetaceae bacterium]
MRQTLFHIPTTINGIPVFGLFGIAFIFFVLCILAAMIWRFVKVRRFDGEMFSYLFFVVVVGFVFSGIVPNILEADGFPIRGYGVCLLLAILSAIGLGVWLGSGRGIAADTMISLGFWVTICGIIGTRVFYIIEYHEHIEVWNEGKLQLLPTLYNVVNIANGGLVVIGGIIGGALGGMIFALRNKYSILLILDLVVPTVMLGIAIGRVGCFLNGCCFGAVCDLPWAVTFPEGSPAHVCQIDRGDTTYCGLKFKQPAREQKIRFNQLILSEILPDSNPNQAAKLKTGLRLDRISGYNSKNEIQTYSVRFPDHVFDTVNYFQQENPNRTIRFEFFDEGNPESKLSYIALPNHSGVLPVHPTQIYSSIIALILCAILLLLSRISWFRTHYGGITAVFLILYGTARYCIENVRTDEEPFLSTGITIAQNLSILLIVVGLTLLVFVTMKEDKIKEDKI